MARLVTQLVEELPKVLIISHRSWLDQKLTSFFERHDLQVTTLKPEEIMANPARLHENWYRVVWLVGWTESEYLKGSEEISHVLDKVNLANLEVTAILRIITPLKSKQEELTEYVYQVSFQNKVLDIFSRSAKPLSMFLGQDVVPPESSDWQPFSFFKQNLAQKKLLDPQVPLMLQSHHAFFTYLQSKLFNSPSHEIERITGNNYLSTTLLHEVQRIYEHYFEVKLSLSGIPAVRLATYDHLPTYQVPQETVPELIQVAIQALPSPEAAVTSDLNFKKSVPTRIKKEEKNELEKPSQASYREVLPQVAPTISPIETPALEPVADETKIKAESKEKNEDNGENKVDVKVKNIFSLYQAGHKLDRVDEVVKVGKKLKNKNKKRAWSFFAGVGFVGAALAVVSLATFFYFSQIWLEKALAASSLTGQIEEDGSLVKATRLVERQVSAYSLVVPSSFFIDADILVSASHELQGVTSRLDQLETQQRKQVIALFDSTLEVKDFGSGLVSEAIDVYEKLSRVKSRLESILEDEQNQEQRDQLSSFLQKLEKQRDNLVVYQQLQPLLADVLATKEKRTYAVLLQNNQELRATGGFIQAVAILTVDKNLLVDSQVFSVYTLDENLTAIVTPPDDLKDILGEEQLFLRDSNWNPDFGDSAAQATWFLEQKLNKKIDGVFAINLFVLQDLLKEIGPLDLDQYNEVLTDRNILERMEFHSEVTLVESDQSSDYSQVVLSALLQRITTLPEEKVGGLLAALHSSLKSKDLLLSLVRPGEQSTLSSLGWTGEIVEPQCPTQLSTQTCFVDTLMIVDSNVGINKANFHTKRQDSHSIKIENDLATHQHEIIFTNTASSNSWPKGPYKSYLRFYLPENVSQVEISFNGSKVDPSLIRELPSQDKKKVLGLVSETPIKESSEIVLNYAVPLPSQAPFSYAFFNQKQPGVEQPTSIINVQHSPGIKPALIAPQAEVSGNNISFTEFDDDHIFLGISFN